MVHGEWFMVNGYIRFKVNGYYLKEYKKRIEGCHNL